MFTFGVNMFVIWSIEQWCMLDICGPMAILSHQLEVKVFYLENTDVRDNQENQPFLLKVGIWQAIGAYTHISVVYYLYFSTAFNYAYNVLK